MAKRSRAGRLRIHVENDPHHSEVYHITPALFGRRVRRSTGLAGRIAITYGQDPALLDAALAESRSWSSATSMARAWPTARRGCAGFRRPPLGSRSWRQPCRTAWC